MDSRHGDPAVLVREPPLAPPIDPAGGRSRIPRSWALEDIRCFARVLHRHREWDATTMSRDFDPRARLFESIYVFTRYAFETPGNGTVTTTCQAILSAAANQAATTVHGVARLDRHTGTHRCAKDACERRPAQEFRGRRQRRHRRD